MVGANGPATMFQLLVVLMANTHSAHNCFHLQLADLMSTARRLVLSLRGRKDSSQSNAAGTSSTRLCSGSTTLSPGHELSEIAVVSGSGGADSYGSLSQPNGPRPVPGVYKIIMCVVISLFLLEYSNSIGGWNVFRTRFLVVLD